MSGLTLHYGSQVYNQLDREQLQGQWSQGSLTLIDFAAIRDNGLAELIDEVSGAFPEMTVLGARPISGTRFKQSIRSKLPEGGFVDYNEGAKRSKGAREVREFNCKPIKSRWDVDVMLADSESDPWEALMAEEAATHITAELQNVCRQTYYGSENDAKGFPGFHQIYDPALTVDAEGTTDGEKESVWLVRQQLNNCQYLLANNMDLDVTDVRKGDVNDADGNAYTAYIQELMGNIGFKVSNLRWVGRIKNCTTETGKSVTGNLVAELITKFPTNQRPTHCFMSSTQAEEYRKSLITPENKEPALPTTIQNIPIVLTDSIVAGHSLEIV